MLMLWQFMTLFTTLQKIGRERTIDKGEYIFRGGDTDVSFYIFTEGLAKAYYTTHDGKEFIKSFINEGQAISCMQALIESKPCNFAVVALEKCTVLETPKTLFLETMSMQQHLQEANQLLIDLAIKKEQREYEFLCLDAKSRYEAFCDRNPGLLTRLTQVDIARYLGITPVALSRIKGSLR